MLKSSAFFVNLGKIDFALALELQHQIIQLKQAEKLPDFLLFLEHHPVITIGRGGQEKNILATDEALKKQGIQLYYIERGGDVTYHGPGQLVVYFLCDLENRNKDVHLFLRLLEETVILTLQDYGLTAGRIQGLTGVWVENKKVCAMGIAVKKWITFHGLALNVNTNLEHFNLIHPCGIIDKPVSSLQALLGKKMELKEIEEKLASNFAKVFNLEPSWIAPDSLFSFLKLKESLTFSDVKL